MEDWNGDGKEDARDVYEYHEFLNETDQEIGHGGSSRGGSSRGGSSSGGSSSGGMFKVVVGVCVGIVVLALLLGVAIPGAVIELLLKIILIAGLLTLLFKKK